MDITFYPYDKQICSVNIISWGFTAEEVMLEAADTPVNLDDFEYELLYNKLHVFLYTVAFVTVI